VRFGFWVLRGLERRCAFVLCDAIDPRRAPLPWARGPAAVLEQRSGQLITSRRPARGRAGMIPARHLYLRLRESLPSKTPPLASTHLLPPNPYNRSSRASSRAARSRTASSSAARPPRCPASTRPASTTSRASRSARSCRARSSTARASPLAPRARPCSRRSRGTDRTGPCPACRCSGR